MRYKVGDKVRIKSLDWYYENRDKIDQIDCGNVCFVHNMATLCGKIVTISSILPMLEAYRIEEDDGEFNWTDEMIEGLVEEEIGLVDTLSSRWVNEFSLPEGYIFKDENGNVINTTKIILEKKNKYPKTYEECSKVLGIPIHGGIALVGNWCMEDGYIVQHLETLRALSKLFICHDAYWKIAGEEMGLGKPWEPDYDSGVNKYGIIYMNGVVQKSNPTTNWERHLNKILDFPTEEMRDAFYENFKELIESCKELL